jgi:hypothetical protein
MTCAVAVLVAVGVAVKFARARPPSSVPPGELTDVRHPRRGRPGVHLVHRQAAGRPDHRTELQHAGAAGPGTQHYWSFLPRLKLGAVDPYDLEVRAHPQARFEELRAAWGPGATTTDRFVPNVVTAGQRTPVGAADVPVHAG